MTAFLLLKLFVGIASIVLLKRLSQSLLSARAPLPPGPKGEFIIGHIRAAPTEYRWLTYTAWAKKYGDIFYMHMLGRPVIILSALEHAQELMDKRGAIYSDRPRMVLIAEMMDLKSMTFMRYGELWRSHRRLIQQYFNSRAVATFRPHQVHEVHILLNDLLNEPDKFWSSTKRFVASAVLSVTYGYRVLSENDPLVEFVERGNTYIAKHGNPGTTFVDMFPLLRFIPSFLPGGYFRQFAREGREIFREMTERPFNMVKEQRASGTALPSLALSLIDDYERRGGNDLERSQASKEVAGTLYRAGVETTVTVIHVFILAMILYPQAAKKAQEELDNIVGDDRLPGFEDRAALPYLDCILKECLRWNPPFPLGVPHRAMQDDELEGKFIPEGSIIMPNIWMMMHDERKYKDPDLFIPERFMTAETLLDPSTVVFGFGRRICPGRHFAEASIWLVVANILSTFDILPAVDGEGREVPPEPLFTPNLTSQPLQFNCRFVPRSNKSAQLIATNSPKA